MAPGCDLNTAAVKQAALGQVELDQRDAVIDHGPGLIDAAEEQVALGLGHQQGRACTHVEALFFGLQRFFLQGPGGPGGRDLLSGALRFIGRDADFQLHRDLKLGAGGQGLADAGRGPGIAALNADFFFRYSPNSPAHRAARK